MTERQKQRRLGRGAVEILEEATHLLRQASAATLAWYLAGTVPFLLGLLYFWADMSRSPFAGEHLAAASLALALLYGWMKFAQARFAHRLRSQLSGGGEPRSSVGQLLRVAVLQTAVLPWSFLALPVALLFTFPFGWCFAFFQNVTVLAPGAGEPLRQTLGRAWRQSRLWPGQNHLALLILLLFSLVVLLGLAVAAYLIPQMLKTLLGVESQFTRANLHLLLNTTFWAMVGALTFLAVDPLVKAFYVLRCFYGESLQSGEDLLIDLRRLSRRAGGALAVLFLAGALLFGSPEPATATEAPSEAPLAEELDRAISAEIEGLEYAWRTPREAPVVEREPPAFLVAIYETLAEWGRWTGKQIETFFRWLLRLLPKIEPPDPSRKSEGWGGFEALYIWLYLLLGVVASAAAVLFYRRWSRGRDRAPVQRPEELSGPPDLEAEEVSAEDLPVDRWLALGEELLARGEARLALRAFALGALAHLAGESLVSLGSAKSNRDYLGELRRRAHDRPGLLGAFAENIRLLESVWYGSAAAGTELIDTFLANHRRILALDSRP